MLFAEEIVEFTGKGMQVFTENRSRFFASGMMLQLLCWI